MTDNNETTIEESACYRPHGFEYDQIALRLESKIEMPDIRLINATKNDVIFNVILDKSLCIHNKLK